MEETMTIFLEQVYRDNEALINERTLCGKIGTIFLAPDTYWAAKETAWDDTLIVNDPSEFSNAFTALDNGAIQSLTMDIPVFLQLKRDTTVVDENGNIVTDPDTGVPMDTFNEDVHNV